MNCCAICSNTIIISFDKDNTSKLLTVKDAAMRVFLVQEFDTAHYSYVKLHLWVTQVAGPHYLLHGVQGNHCAEHAESIRIHR